MKPSAHTRLQRPLWLTLLALAGLLGMAGPAGAWGDEGHRITGLVAQQLLTDKARAQIKALMGSDDLGTISLHMDKFKMQLAKDVPGSREWHYDDRPVCAPDTPKPTYCPNGNCASVQITRHYRALIDQHSTTDQKRFAVFVLVHMIGDIHQPLHSSDHEDRGGNDVRVSFSVNGRSKTTNLHSAWDSDFVAASFSTRDERVIAQQLVQGLDPGKLKEWQSGAADKWLAETFALATDPAYGKLPGFSCNAELGSDTLELDGAYVDQAKKLIPTQLTKAGARIAYLLNRALGK